MKAKECHPDKGATDDTKFKQLVTARDLLVNPDARELVDIELQRKRHKI